MYVIILIVIFLVRLRALEHNYHDRILSLRSSADQCYQSCRLRIQSDTRSMQDVRATAQISFSASYAVLSETQTANAYPVNPNALQKVPESIACLRFTPV
jgi:hypothetical protein